MKEYICHENGCGRTYTNPYNLKRHQVIKHFKTKVFKCTICDRELSSMQNLREHDSMHKGEKPYECNFCGVRYRYCSQLSNHKKIHRRINENMQFVELKVRNIQLTDLIKYAKFDLDHVLDKEFEPFNEILDSLSE